MLFFFFDNMHDVNRGAVNLSQRIQQSLLRRNSEYKRIDWHYIDLSIPINESRTIKYYQF